MNNIKPEYYTNNNKVFNYNNNYLPNKYNTNYSKNSSLDLIAKVCFIIFCFLAVFVIYDFVIIYKNVKKDNNIERNRCIEEYKASKCDKVIVSDGPIANDFCTEKLKCIHEHTVYFHVILIKYLRSIISNIFRGNNLINISFLSITIAVIIKILY